MDKTYPDLPGFTINTKQNICDNTLDDAAGDAMFARQWAIHGRVHPPRYPASQLDVPASSQQLCLITPYQEIMLRSC